MCNTMAVITVAHNWAFLSYDFCVLQLTAKLYFPPKNIHKMDTERKQIYMASSV